MITVDEGKPALAQAAKPVRPALWMTLVAAGFVFEFTGRFIGYRYNPLGVWLELAPLFGTVSAGAILVFGALKLMQAWTAKGLPGVRRGMLLVMLGGSMLISSMVCKSIVALVCGG